MEPERLSRTLLRRHIALPTDHGSWVFLFSPLLIGLFAGGRWTMASLALISAALAAFLIRQPATVAVKVYSGRRSRRELPAAWLWLGMYGSVASLALGVLILQGFGYLLILAISGLPVFAWHLYLVSRRAERRQMGVELVAVGVLALAAPAGYWVGAGWPDPLGWWLAALTWLQSAASIVHAYLRLEQRELKTTPNLAYRLRMARPALLYTTFNLALAAGISLAGLLPRLLPLPFALQWVETVYGTLKPAIGYRPAAIGIRQLIVSTLFTILFILAWLLG
ncbi:MAG TPA: YwiC-like family protein [Anaerolineales bacterium]|nr:YwiC-like family protein [Anaerolineales bacterium]